MKKTQQELDAYKIIRKKLEEEFFILEILEKGALLGENEAIYTEDEKIFQMVVERYKTAESIDYWASQNDWSVQQGYSERYKRQREFVETGFIPHLEKSQRVGDLACANGIWSIWISRYVKWVDGFEYSANMVETAKRRADLEKIENIRFVQADACNLVLENIYDNFMMMGLLTCILSPYNVEKIINNVAGALKSGGRLITKDTVNVMGEDVVYLYNKLSQYKAAYWSKEKYISYFEKAGFRLEQGKILDEIQQDGISVISLGEIWVKQ